MVIWHKVKTNKPTIHNPRNPLDSLMAVRIQKKVTVNANNQYGPSPFKTGSSFSKLLIFFEWEVFLKLFLSQEQDCIRFEEVMKVTRSRLNEKLHDKTGSILTAGKKLQQKEKKTEDQKDIHLLNLVFNHLSRVPKLCRKMGCVGMCGCVWIQLFQNIWQLHSMQTGRPI